MPPSPNPGGTHWEGCENAHHACALALLKEAREQLAVARAERDRLRDAVRAYGAAIMARDKSSEEYIRGTRDTRQALFDIAEVDMLAMGGAEAATDVQPKEEK